MNGLRFPPAGHLCVFEARVPQDGLASQRLAVYEGPDVTSIALEALPAM